MLVKLAKADNQFAQVEKDLIIDIAESKKFPKHKLQQLMKHSEPLGSLGALSENQKFEYLCSAINLMKADNKIHQSEVLFCQNLAIKMGFNKKVVKMLIEEADSEPYKTNT